MCVKERKVESGKWKVERGKWKVAIHDSGVVVHELAGGQCVFDGYKAEETLHQ